MMLKISFNSDLSNHLKNGVIGNNLRIRPLPPSVHAMIGGLDLISNNNSTFKRKIRPCHIIQSTLGSNTGRIQSANLDSTFQCYSFDSYLLIILWQI